MVAGITNPATQECLEHCTTAESACLDTIQYGLQKGGRYAESGLLSVLLCCADACDATATFLRMESEFEARMCALTADVCLRAALECDHFGTDPILRQCADACRRCADACERLAEVTA